jgi:hypothetical protein
MISVISSWFDCLKLLQPKNLKLFALVSIKSIGEVYKALYKNFWWLLLLYFVLDLGSAFFNDKNCDNLNYINEVNDVSWSKIFTQMLSMFSAELLYYGIFFLIFLLCRASVPLKNMRYVKKFWRHFLYTMLFFALLIAFFISIGVILFVIHDFTGDFVVKLADIIYKGFIFCLVPFFIFFLLDSPATLGNFFRAIKRAALMAFYNYPLCLLFAIVFYELFYKLMSKGLVFLLTAVGVPITLYLPGNHVIFLVEHIVRFIMLIGIVAPICFMASLYIKRLHEQFIIYFDVKG